MAGSNPSAKAQAQLGLPDGFKTYTPFPFAGMDTESSPVAMDDKEFVWRENFIRLGNGNLRTAWDVGTPIYTAPNGKTIIYFAFFTIATTYYCAVFLSDGSAVQINVDTLAQTTIGTHGFYSAVTGYKPYVRQWGDQWILICNRNTVNDYWAWDGNLLYTAGTAAPNGVNILSGGFNYSYAPSVTAFGGRGSGMTFTATEQAGSIVAINITNPGTGYEVGDVVQLNFGGGGSDFSPELVAHLTAGGVGGVNITAPGTGYTSASVIFGGGGGTGAAGIVVINTGVVSVPVTANGTDYTFAVVSFTGGGGTGAAATADIVGGAIASITVTNAGQNYTSAPTASIVGTGTGATPGTVVIGGGAIVGVEITSAGTGYTTAPNVVFTGTGSGALGVALLRPQGVEYVTVVGQGSGFTSVPLVAFVGGGGAGATGTVQLNSTEVASVQLTSGGSGYNYVPTVTFIGGGGYGAAAACIMNGDMVARVVVTNPGSLYYGPIEVSFSGPSIAGQTGGGAGGFVLYYPTSIAGVVVSASGSFYTSAPSVQIGAGANNSAYATVNLMPYGVSGLAMESFLSRVWIVAPAQSTYATIPAAGQFAVSAPDSIWDFAPSDGGEFQDNVDSFLQTTYTGVRQSSGYLYFFGDESVSVVSNVATSGNPVVTTFNYQNVDPQAGLSWRDALSDFGRAELMGNTIGVFGLYGGAATKVSAKVDGVFRKAVFPPFAGALTPSSAIATIFDIKHYLMLMTVVDPDTFQTRNVMIAWNEKDWGILSQSPALNFIGTQPVGTTFNAYGTDGTHLYPLFASPSTAITKRIDTKFYGSDQQFIVKQLYGTWLTACDLSAGSVGISGTMTAVLSGATNANAATGETIIDQTFSRWSQPLSITSPAPYFSTWGASPAAAVPTIATDPTTGQLTAYVGFINVGLRFNSTSPDFVLGNWVIGYGHVKALF